jgi:hypothetical protein
MPPYGGQTSGGRRECCRGWSWSIWVSTGPDLSGAEHLFQVVAEGVMSVFPALRTAVAVPNNLPLPVDHCGSGRGTGGGGGGVGVVAGD